MKSGQIRAAFFVSVCLDFHSADYYTSRQENSHQRAKYRAIPRISKNFRTFAPTNENKASNESKKRNPRPPTFGRDSGNQTPYQGLQREPNHNQHSRRI
jgi:hypothetical protein